MLLDNKQQQRQQTRKTSYYYVERIPRHLPNCRQILRWKKLLFSRRLFFYFHQQHQLHNLNTVRRASIKHHFAWPPIPIPQKLGITKSPADKVMSTHINLPDPNELNKMFKCFNSWSGYRWIIVLTIEWTYIDHVVYYNIKKKWGNLVNMFSRQRDRGGKWFRLSHSTEFQRSRRRDQYHVLLFIHVYQRMRDHGAFWRRHRWKQIRNYAVREP